MVEKDILLNGQSSNLGIENEVMFLESLQDIERLEAAMPLKTQWNAIVHCRQGRIQLEVGSNQVVKVQEGQLLLIPAQKLMHTMMVSTNVDVGVLLVSERVMNSVLGPQIDIWHRAMYLHETYVIDMQRWSNAMKSQSRAMFNGGELVLFKEFVFSYLRIFLLIICEELLRKERGQQSDDPVELHPSTHRDKALFQQFLDLLHHEEYKRQQVGYYAEQLCISSKYLTSVCRKVSGKSPLRWITDSVMEDSYQLLRNTNMTVKEISNRLGFPNSSFFGQYFREQAGMTPMDYRNAIKNKG